MYTFYLLSFVGTSQSPFSIYPTSIWRNYIENKSADALLIKLLQLFRMRVMWLMEMKREMNLIFFIFYIIFSSVFRSLLLFPIKPNRTKSKKKNSVIFISLLLLFVDIQYIYTSFFFASLIFTIRWCSISVAITSYSSHLRQVNNNNNKKLNKKYTYIIIIKIIWLTLFEAYINATCHTINIFNIEN